MGPIRGSRRKRRQDKRQAVAAAAAAALLASTRPDTFDWWDDFSNRIAGFKVGGDSFESVFKISRKTFNYVCSLVKDDLVSKPSTFTFKNGDLLSLNDQVAVALRRLSSGESLFTIGQLFGINQSSVSQITWRFVEAMEERGLRHLRWPEEEMGAIKSKFEKTLGLPNCCGVIDSTHIMMCLPSVDSSNNVWIDHEKRHSMVLQAVLDPDMRFRDIVTGWPGSMDELSVLHSSGFFKLCEKGMRLNGKKQKLSDNSDVREYVIGDSGFPLLPWLLTPYQGKDLREFEAEFNRRHSKARLVAQRALSRLKDTWKIVHGEMWRPDKHRLPRIILVCCLLHNIIIDLKDETFGQLISSHDHDAPYKQQYCTVVDKNATAMRDELSLHLSGRLPP